MDGNECFKLRVSSFSPRPSYHNMAHAYLYQPLISHRCLRQFCCCAVQVLVKISLLR